MGTDRTAQEAMFGAQRWPEWEGNPEGEGHTCPRG